MKNPLSAFSSRGSARSVKTGDTVAPNATAPLHDHDTPPAEFSSRASRRTWLFIAGGLAIALGVSGVVTYNTMHKTVTLDVDGHVTTVSTFAGSVDGVLNEQGVIVGPNVVVAPAASSSLSGDSAVVVRYSRDITIEKDGVPTTVTTTAVDADEFLATYSDHGDGVSLVASRSAGEGRTDLGLRLSVDGPVQLKADGVTTQIADGSRNVSDILASQNIILGDLDRLTVEHLPTEAALAAQAAAAARAAANPAVVPATTDAAANFFGIVSVPAVIAPTAVASDVIADPRATETELTVVVRRVGVTEVAADAAIPFETVTEEDSTRFKDLPIVVKTEGVDGVQTTIYSVTTVDGVEESRTLVSDATTTEPVAQVLVQGTKERPKVVTPPKATVTPPSSTTGSTDTTTAPVASAPAVATGDVWSKLAACESGGNASIVSANGKYHGLYQFSVGTWQSLGGAGLPSQASADEQTRLAQALQARSGWGQWPACSRKLGLM